MAKEAAKEAKKKDKGAKAQKAAAPTGPVRETPEGYVPRLKTRYAEEVVPKLRKEFGIENVMAVPRIERISLNMGMGEAIQNIKILDDAVEEMTALAGQKPTITRAQKSIAAFKLREEMPVGVAVTLRQARMWEFFDRLTSIAIPRIRDFRGLNPKSFDGRGNYALGIREHIVFPEVNYDKVDQIWGMDIVVCTTAKTDDEARALLKAFNFPFRQ